VPLSAAASAAHPEPAAVAAETAAPSRAATLTVELPAADDGDWGARIEAMQLDQLTRQLARHCAWLGMSDGAVRLLLEHGARHLLTDERRGVVERALSAHLRTPVRLTVEVAAENQLIPSVTQRDRDRAVQLQRDAETAFESDVTVQDFKRVFGATVRPGSVQPLN
jgi:DNA polymerase-3 subunit gamma/tau